MYSAIYELFSLHLFDNAMTPLQSNTVEVLATACTIFVGLAPIFLTIKIILSFCDF